MSSVVYPHWTAKASTSGGTDHLGYRRPSTTLYALLVPFLTNQTNSIRYYSFYAWLLSCFQEKIKRECTISNTEIQLSKLKEDWDAFLRAGEMLIALYNRGNRGVVGSDWARRLTKKNIIFSEEQHFKNTGLNQYYKGVLRKLGVLEDSEGVPILSPERDSLGQRLARSFCQDESLSKNFIKLIEEGKVSIEDLEDTEKRFSLRHFEEQEKKLLIEILFEKPIEPIQRQTFQALIYVLEYKKNLGEYRNDENQFSWLMYSNQVQNGTLLSLPEELTNVQQLWALYHFCELYHIAMERLLYLVLVAIPLDEQGISIADVLQKVVFEPMEDTESFALSWDEFSSKYPLSEDPSCDEDYSEKTLSRSDSLLHITILLAQLQKRFQEESLHKTNFLNNISQHKEDSIVGFINFVQGNKDLSIRDFMVKLVRHKVIERHLLIAINKLKGGTDTFLFRIRSNYLIHPSVTGFKVEYTSPRIVNCYRALSDLGIVDGTLTEEGKKLMGNEVLE